MYNFEVIDDEVFLLYLSSTSSSVNYGLLFVALGLFHFLLCKLFWLYMQEVLDV